MCNYSNVHYKNYIQYLQLKFSDISIAFRFRLLLDKYYRLRWQKLFTKTILPNKMQDKQTLRKLGTFFKRQSRSMSNVHFINKSRRLQIDNSITRSTTIQINEESVLEATTDDIVETNCNSMAKASLISNNTDTMNSQQQQQQQQQLARMSFSESKNNIDNNTHEQECTQQQKNGATVYPSTSINDEFYQYHSFVIKMTNRNYECDRLLLITTKFVYFVFVQPTSIDQPTIIKHVKWSLPLEGMVSLTLDKHDRRLSDGVNNELSTLLFELNCDEIKKSSDAYLQLAVDNKDGKIRKGYKISTNDVETEMCEYKYKHRILFESQFKKFAFVDTKERLMFVRECQRIYYHLCNRKQLTVIQRYDDSQATAALNDKNDEDTATGRQHSVSLDSSDNESIVSESSDEGTDHGKSGYLMKFRKLNQHKSVKKWVRWVPKMDSKEHEATGVIEWCDHPTSLKIYRGMCVYSIIFLDVMKMNRNNVCNII